MPNTFQESACRMLSYLATELNLTPDRLSTDNGIQYKGIDSHTVYTVYDRELDTLNLEAVEVAFGLELGIPEETGLSNAQVMHWFENVLRPMFPPAERKTSLNWHRVSLHSFDDIRLFNREVKKLIASRDIGPGFQPLTEATPLPPQNFRAPESSVMDKVAVRPIVERRGQPAFRQALLSAYESACAVTRCTDTAVLEAAHITPHSEGQDYRTANGVLLRTDLHTLFDLRLLSVDPVTAKVFISRRLSGTYQELAGTTIHIPELGEHRPDLQGLKKHYLVCVWLWHLELSREPAEHRVHGEHGGLGVHGVDGVCHSLPERGRHDRLHAQAGAGRLDASRRRDPVSVSQQAATCVAAALQFGCSTASAAG